MINVSFSPETSGDAWHRIMISSLFGWIIFLAGLFFYTMNATFFGFFFFTFVGILAYVFIDSLLFLIMHGDDAIEKHTLTIVGSVFSLILNLVILYGVYMLYSI